MSLEFLARLTRGKFYISNSLREYRNTQVVDKKKYLSIEPKNRTQLATHNIFETPNKVGLAQTPAHPNTTMTKYNLKSAAGNKQPNFNFISSTAENNKSRVSYNLDEKYFNPSNQKLTISKPNQCTSPSNRIRTNNFLESSERKPSPLNRKLRDRNHPLRESLKNTHSRLSQRQRG